MTTEELKKMGLTEEQIALAFHREMKQRIIDYIPVVAGLFTDVMVETNAETMNFSCNLGKFGKKCEITIKIEDLG